MATIFNGKKFSLEREKELKIKISFLKKKKITPKLVSILVGNDKASKIYLNLKKKCAEKLGLKFAIKVFSSETKLSEIGKFIQKSNKDKSIHGIMIQLPLPATFSSEDKKQLLNFIEPTKDVDGLTDKSPFVPATARAVASIIQFAIKPLAYVGKKAAVVGASGTVGKSVTVELEKLGFKVTECEKHTRDFYAKLHEVDLVVSATGQESLIKSEMLKEGVIAIDVGAPKAEMDAKVSTKASFLTPVPGGVGPVTIVSLLENLVDVVYNTQV